MIHLKWRRHVMLKFRESSLIFFSNYLIVFQLKLLSLKLRKNLITRIYRQTLPAMWARKKANKLSIINCLSLIATQDKYHQTTAGFLDFTDLGLAKVRRKAINYFLKKVHLLILAKVLNTLLHPQTELFAKINTGFQPLTIFEKRSILDVWQGSEYASEKAIHHHHHQHIRAVSSALTLKIIYLILKTLQITL